VVRATRTRLKKGEAGRTARGRTAAGRREMGQAEADRTGAGRTQTDRTQTDRTQTGQTEASQAEASRTETGTTQAGHADTGQAETGHGAKVQTDTGPIETLYAEIGSPRRPRTDSLELGALAGAIPSARLHARFVLQEWGLDAIAENTELVVSELVTNAVQATWHAGTGDPVRLSLLADDRSVLVVVSDAIPDPPRPRHAGPGDEEGRGLTIVGKVSDWWDWKPARGGKLVRALVAAHPARQ
jgi:anti-sigma regulatory factor (Ser/Thr protein kinase)